jgi:SAM-dependent methyltransferase
VEHFAGNAGKGLFALDQLPGRSGPELIFIRHNFFPLFLFNRFGKTDFIYYSQDMMKEMWEDRYSGETYAYGTEPNTFFRKVLDTMKPGRLLLPADGEGRNGVYAATAGWDVLCVDFSQNARRKAVELANQRKVHIHYNISDIVSYDYPHERFDCIALVYVHLPSEKRTQLHLQLVWALKPGGTIIIESFSKNQLRYASGGPRDEGLLYSAEDLKNDFSGLDIVSLSEEDIILNEGPFHQGKASVVRMIAHKKP